MIRKILQQAYRQPLHCALGAPCRRPVRVALGIMMLATLVVPVDAQQVRRMGPRRGTKDLPPEVVVIEPSAPVENLFARADEGIARRDWKFAIDSLQRIIDYPDGSLLPVFEEDDPIDELFESAGRRAVRVLATMPPEGLAAYRLIHDGMAKRLLEAGKRAHDPKPLRTLIARFLLTQYADEAVDLLASWALDAGRPGEVIALLGDLAELVPGFDAPNEALDAKLAVAYALLGRDQQASEVVDNIRASRGRGRLRVRRLSDALASIKRAGFAEIEPTPQGWPVAGGTPERRGRMSEADPMLTGPVPWHVGLAGARPDAWRRVFRDGPDAPLVLPVGRPVSDGKRLFARTRLGCTALGADTLNVLWDVRLDTGGSTAASPPPRSRGRRVPVGTWVSPLTDKGLFFDDYVAGDVALSGDLVTVVSRTGRTEYALSHRDLRNEGFIAWALNPLLGTRAIHGTRLVAIDRSSGDVRWARGRSGEPNDPLGDVLFRSTPLQVGQYLWIVYSRNHDLYVAVLDPKDGALIARVSLGSVSHLRNTKPPTLPLAAWDGLVFVPSGHGVLFAVNAFNYSIRWAHRYAFPDAGVPMPDHDDGWLPCPPTVAGGMLLVAPSFGFRLYAFEAVSGEMAWSTPLVKSKYIIAADSKRVWLGGRSIACADVTTGEILWQESLQSPPTGRAVLCGERILIPGLNGLTTLDAATGASVGVTELPTGEPPLGNLLCLNHAVYSLQSGTVRKYPDVDRSYPGALQAFEEDPTRTSTALSLAWLELLRGDPQRAFDILEAITSSDQPEDSTLAQELAHARVESLLGMAGRQDLNGRSADVVLGLLEAAVKEARTATDRLRCTMAVADQLVAMERSGDAYRLLWSFGAEPEAETVVSLDHQVYGRARGLIRKRLIDIQATSSEDEVSQLRAFRVARADSVLSRVQSGEGDRVDRTTLRAMADLGLRDAPEQRLLVALARDHANNDQFARAEQILRESIARNSAPAFTAATNLLLADWQANAVREGYGSAFALQERLDALEEQYGGMLAADLHRAIGASILPDELVETASDWIASLRRDLQFSDPILDTSRTGNVSVQFGMAPLWSTQAQRRVDQARFIHFGRAAASAFDDRYLSLNPSGVLRCYRCSDRELVWEADLRVPGTFQRTPLARWPEGEGVVRHGVIDGQTALISTRSGLFAIELGTGRRLWVQPYDFGEHVPGAGRLERRMAIGDGFAACVLRPGRISLLRVSDGLTLWERDLFGERVGSIKMWRDRLISADPFMKRVHLLDRQNGSLIRRMLFHQPDPQNYLVNLVRVGNLLCGLEKAEDFETVTAIDLITGENRWQIPLDKPVVQMFRAADGYLGIGLLGGDVWIVDTASGEVVLDRRVAGARGVVRGALVDGTLVLQYFKVRGSVRVLEMVGLDVATDVELWRREDVIPLLSSEESIGLVGGCVPVFQHSGQHARRARVPLKAAMLDIRTGTGIGPAPPVPGATRLNQFHGDFILLPHSGIAVVGLETGAHAFRVTVAKNHTGRDF